MNQNKKNGSFPDIAQSLLQWWDQGHVDLPWRQTTDPYAIWISEVMLQQTQINTVIPYYHRWMAKFPTVTSLATATLTDVLKLWEGLGYYSRARNTHKAAQLILTEFDGRLPETINELITLPGIGRYTAGAIASIAYNQKAPILDGNVIRVLSRLLDLADDVTKSRTKTLLWSNAEGMVPRKRPGEFNQALMELGQQICVPANPKCSRCPLSAVCQARQRGSQLDRPVRPPRKRTPHYDVVAGIIWRSANRSPKSSFLITRRPVDGLLGGLWEFPGGKKEDGETLEEALNREIREELDIRIATDNQLTTIKHAYTHFRITLHAFFANFIEGQIRHIGVTDHAWVTLDNIHEYPFAATDQKIIIALKANLEDGQPKSSS